MWFKVKERKKNTDTKTKHKKNNFINKKEKKRKGRKLKKKKKKKKKISYSTKLIYGWKNQYKYVRLFRAERDLVSFRELF